MHFWSDRDRKSLDLEAKRHSQDLQWDYTYVIHLPLLILYMFTDKEKNHRASNTKGFPFLNYNHYIWHNILRDNNTSQISKKCTVNIKVNTIGWLCEKWVLPCSIFGIWFSIAVPIQMKSQESNGFLANGAGTWKYGEGKPWIIPLRGLGSYCPIAAISITYP